MNMNRSGHNELRDPDWFLRSADRAKLSPTTIDTESLGGSLNSLNLSFNTLADDHVSVRSLPVLANSGASIAASADAPWNQSPQSLRHPLRTPARTPSRRGQSSMSALDQLESSISSLRHTTPPLTAIITEEDEASIHSLVGFQDTEAAPTNNEMDATAHAGNRSHAQQQQLLQQQHGELTKQQQQPVSPLRTSFPTDSSYAGSSITSARSWRPRHHSSLPTDEQSLSTLGDGDDEDFGADDDDNISIIKLLRHQVEALKGQLIAEQEKNRSARAPRVVLERSVGSFGHDYSSDADSFGGDDVSSKVSSDRCASSFSKLPDAQLQDKFGQAQEGMALAVQSIRASWNRRAPANNDDENLVDELVLCEVEALAKAMQREYIAQRTEYNHDRELWEKKCAAQERVIAELKTQASG